MNNKLQELLEWCEKTRHNDIHAHQGCWDNVERKIKEMLQNENH